jgi:hypothetical protein
MNARMRTGIQWCVLSGLLVCSASCGGDRPLQEKSWTGVPGNLLEWGAGQNVIYGQKGVPLGGEESKDAFDREYEYTIVLRQWEGDVLGPASNQESPGSVFQTPLAGERWGFFVSPGDPYSGWPFAIANRNEFGKLLFQHDAPKGWVFHSAGTNRSGNIVALLATTSVESDAHDWERPLQRIALVDPQTGAIKWHDAFPGHRTVKFPKSTVSEDQKHIAIIGWNNGIAMYGITKKKLLWAKTPFEEAGTRAAVFAPDGKTIYTGGTEGRVYEISVADGKVQSRRWATATGESIYTVRINAMAISPDGRWLAVGNGAYKGEVYLWDLHKSAAAKPRVFHHSEGGISILQFSPNGRRFVSVGGGVLKVWPIDQ